MTRTPQGDAIRATYDLVARDYADLFRDALATNPFDRAVLHAFADLVTADGGGPVWDVGCGPGRITAPLQALGLDVRGVDLSPEMVEVARAEHPAIGFEVGSMTALDVPDGQLAGIVAWYSVIHTPPADLPRIYAEFHRALRPGGHLVVAFQVGHERVRLQHAYGHDIALDAYRLDPDQVAASLGRACFTATARLTRAARPPEQQEQAYLFARADGPQPR